MADYPAASLLILDTTNREDEDLVLYASSFDVEHIDGAVARGRLPSMGSDSGSDDGRAALGADGLALAPPTLAANPCHERVLACGKLLAGSCGVTKNLLGQAARTMTFGGDADGDLDSGMCAAFMDADFAVFVLVLPASHPRQRCQLLAFELFDLLVTFFGPATPRLARWGSTLERVRSLVDPVAAAFLSSQLVAPADSPVPLVSLLGAGAPSFEPSPELFCALEEVVCDVEATDGADMHLSADGVRLVSPVGACLVHRGVVATAHLGAIDLADCLRALRAVGLLDRRATDETRVFTRSVSAPVTPEGSRFRASDALVTGPWSAPRARPRVEHADAREWATACPDLSLTEDRVLTAVAQQQSVLLILHRVRRERTTELDPFLVDPMKAALHHLRASGCIAELEAQMDACGATPVRPPELPRSLQLDLKRGAMRGDTTAAASSGGGDMATAAIAAAAAAKSVSGAGAGAGIKVGGVLQPTLTAGSDNLLLHFVSFNTFSGVVFHPLPPVDDTDDAGESQRSDAWTAVVNDHFRRCVLRLRTSLLAMQLGAAAAAPRPAKAAEAGGGMLRTASFSSASSGDSCGGGAASGGAHAGARASATAAATAAASAAVDETFGGEFDAISSSDSSDDDDDDRGNAHDTGSRVGFAPDTAAGDTGASGALATEVSSVTSGGGPAALHGKSAEMIFRFGRHNVGDAAAVGGGRRALQRPAHTQELGLGNTAAFAGHPERAAEAPSGALECGARFEVLLAGRGRLRYWVVGRLLPGPPAREFYVCYDASGSVPQSAVDMAFRLNFGAP